MKITAKMILDLLLKKHWKDICVPECKNGSTHYTTGVLKMDLWVMKPWERDEMYTNRTIEHYFHHYYTGTAIESPVERAKKIEALPQVNWKGRSLVSITCIQCGGPRNVPRQIPWCLISLNHFKCPWCLTRG